MAVETQDIFDLLRLLLDDKELPGSGDSSYSLWSNTELFHYIDQAQREFARDTLCLVDASNFNAVTVTQDDAWVDIDPSIVEFKRIYLGSTGDRVEHLSLIDFEKGDMWHSDYGMNKLNSNWMQTSGTPSIAITDMDIDKLRLYPIPTQADTLNMIVYREPLEEIEDASTDLEIPDRFRRALVWGAAVYAYGRDDVETFNAQAAALNAARFQTAKDEALAFIRRKTRRAPTTTYGGI